MSEPTFIKATGDDIQIQVATWGEQGKPVLCIHGLTANCRCWEVIAEAISPRFRLFAPDLRGRGLSEKPSTGYSVLHHIQDIRGLLDSLKIERATIMGHSLGAAITLVFAATHPDRVERIVLFDGAGALSQAQMNAVIQSLKPSLERLEKVFPSIDSYLSSMKKAPFLQSWSPEIENYFRYEIETVDGGVRTNIRLEHIKEEIENLQKIDTSSYYPKVTCPVLVLRATHGILAQNDLVLPETAAEKMLREIPDARKMDIQGANHYSVVLQPNQYRDQAICDFLAE